MAVTAHFFSKDLEIKSVLLQCDLLDGSHTGLRIADELRSIAELWGISEKNVFFVSDNAANMLRASTFLNWNHFGCYEHKLNLIVQDALRTVQPIIEKITRTVTFFKKSCVAKEKLMKYQMNNQNIPQPRTLIKAVSTRWNSTFLMLERFISLKEAIQSTVATINATLPVISNEEWDYLDQICIALKPFYEVTNVMSGENYLTASTAMVLVYSLISICNGLATRDYHEPVIDLIGKLIQGLNERLGDIKNNTNITICTLLDPRYKHVAFPDAQSLEHTKTYLLNSMTSLLEDDNPAPPTDTNESPNIISIWGELDQKIQSSRSPKTALTKATEELEMYLKEPVISRTNCPLDWWRTHKLIYPILFKIFKCKCNIMVSSVPCERAFSKAGYIINDRRTRLTTSKVAQIMFLNANKI